VGDGRGDFDGQQAGDADEEADDALGVSSSCLCCAMLLLTVNALPVTNDWMLPSTPESIRTKPRTSPEKRMAGRSAIAERAFCQYARSSVLPSTDLSADLINTAWIATIAAENTPRTMPSTGASGPATSAVLAPLLEAAPPMNGAGINA